MEWIGMVAWHPWGHGTALEVHLISTDIPIVIFYCISLAGLPMDRH